MSLGLGGFFRILRGMKTAGGHVSFEKGPHTELMYPSVENYCTSSCFRDFICDFVGLGDRRIAFPEFLKGVSLMPQMPLGVIIIIWGLGRWVRSQ